MENSNIKILLVDDQADDAMLTQRALAQSAPRLYQVHTAICLADAIAELRIHAFDLVLLDLGLPESSGIETLRGFRQGCEVDVPVIVLTGLCDEDTALHALEEGAQDYLIKDEVNPESLSRSIRYSLQRHQLRLQLEEANELLQQKNTRLSELYETAQQFVDNVSHEFRTPLTVIREFTSIVRDGLDGTVNEQQCDHLDKVIHRTDDLALMVDDMLDISKLEAGLLSVWRRPCQVKSLFENVSSILTGRANTKSIRLTFDVPDDLPEIFCDEEKACRVIINLGVNALKFTPAGGEICIFAKHNPDNAEIVIGVQDTGPGISAENLSIIFDRFQQIEGSIRCSTKGFGLGLNIAKELVALNLGKMDVESTPGLGSVFSFTVPCYDTTCVFDRFIEKSIQQSTTPTAISLISVAAQSDSPDAMPVVDEFLQRVVRGRDLVLKTKTEKWVLVAKCPQHELTDLVQRISKEWQSYVRNSPSEMMPQLQLTSQGTWLLPDKFERLKYKFCELQSSGLQGSRRKVLVVDDNPDVNHCLGMRLSAAGFEVFSAADGEEGLAAINQHAPDAVVLDVRMPKLNGMQVLERMRADSTTKNTPVVMLSASVRDQNQALEAGANFFVPKPYHPSDVLSAIESSMTLARK